MTGTWCVPPDAVSGSYDSATDKMVHIVTGYVLDRQSGNMAGISVDRAVAACGDSLSYVFLRTLCTKLRGNKIKYFS